MVVVVIVASVASKEDVTDDLAGNSAKGIPISIRRIGKCKERVEVCTMNSVRITHLL